MTCHEAEELILESFDGVGGACFSLPNPLSRLHGHLAHCPACREFFETQVALDASLVEFHKAPALSPAFDAELTRRVALQRRRERSDYLPDLLHWSGGLATSLLCVWLLPLPPAAVVTAGLAVTFAGYLLLRAVTFCDDM